MYSKRGMDFYQTGSLGKENMDVYQLGFNFLRKNNNRESLCKIGFMLMKNIDGGKIYGFLHHKEGCSLVIELHQGSRTFKLEVAGEDTEGRKRVAKTLIDLIGLKLEDGKVLPK
jgi:hypothetical protein|tara:strand:- start:1097 stop:1438 length:342 start_codon:yes stop_codon:yes gene_type:complete